MSGDLKTLTTAFEALINTRPWLSDVSVLELPWQQEKLDAIRRRKCKSSKSNGNLVFGMMASDEVSGPDPAIQRGLAIVKEALENCGYEVWNFTK